MKFNASLTQMYYDTVTGAWKWAYTAMDANGDVIGYTPYEARPFVSLTRGPRGILYNPGQHNTAVWHHDALLLKNGYHPIKLHIGWWADDPIVRDHLWVAIRRNTPDRVWEVRYSQEETIYYQIEHPDCTLPVFTPGQRINKAQRGEWRRKVDQLPPMPPRELPLSHHPRGLERSLYMRPEGAEGRTI